MSNDEITIKNQTGKHFKVKKNSKKKKQESNLIGKKTQRG
jgi:hypothetical protein